MEHNSIEFVVGHINIERDWQYAIIIQGPYLCHTDTVVRMFLERNLDTLIIVSTYIDQRIRDIAESNVKNHAGRLIYISVRLPSRDTEPDFWRTNYWNQNCQILTSFVGLQFARDIGISFALKIRSDAFLGKKDVCSYMRETLLEKYPVRHENLQGRIVIPAYGKIKSEITVEPRVCMHDVPDFWFFGHIEDLLKYFDVRQGSKWDYGRGITMQFFPESNLAELWMRQVDIPSETTMEQLLGRYMIVADSMDIEFVWLGRWHPDLERYLREGHIYLKLQYHAEERHWKLVGHDRWKEFVTRHSL
jgi:hypothetical protein